MQLFDRHDAEVKAISSGALSSDRAGEKGRGTRAAEHHPLTLARDSLMMMITISAVSLLWRQFVCFFDELLKKPDGYLRMQSAIISSRSMIRDLPTSLT